MYINSGTMDLDTSEVAMGLRFSVRMQVISMNNFNMELALWIRNKVAGDDVHVEISNMTMSEYVGPWDKR